MEISALPGYSDFVTTLTTSDEFAKSWGGAQAAGQTADQFAALRLFEFMTQVVSTANRATFERQLQANADAALAAAATSIAAISAQPVSGLVETPTP